jgi:hypothetical protein
MRLDQPEQASDAYDRYLMQPGLSAQDKAEARAELQELRDRSSILTVGSVPSRATVFLDGKHGEPAGMTPFSVQITPGPHKVEVEQRGYKSYAQDIDARFGRAIIVDAQLERDPHQSLLPPPTPTTPEKPDKSDKPDKPAAPERTGEYDAPKRFTAMGQVDVVFGKLGAYSESARVGLALGFVYWFLDAPKLLLGGGVRLHVATDAWNNTINAPPSGPGCDKPISQSESGTEISGVAMGIIGVRPTPRLRFAVDAGLGASGYSVNAVGGDLFYPTCQPSHGLQPTAHGGLEASYALLPNFRAFVVPISVDVHPAFAGARPSPIDATSAWIRLALGLGVALDL